MTTYVVATVKPWNMLAFFSHTVKMPGTWELVSDPQHLVDLLKIHSPRYIFFPHWSWKVPKEITDKYECVCFHMTDLPYGRGGSPLQNLILRGVNVTALTAFRMMYDEIDAGPVYFKEPLSLEGRAEDIYTRAADLIYQMIEKLIRDNPIPVDQREQDVVHFTRRIPEESLLPMQGTPELLYDHIRMVDAPTYPLAFVDWGDWRIQFHHAEKRDGVIEAQVIIGRKP